MPIKDLGLKAALACLCGARLLMQYQVETAAAVAHLHVLGEMDSPTGDTNSSNATIPAEFVDCEPEETPQTEFVIVLGLFCVAITFTLSYFAERRHLDWLPEATIGVLVGACASAIVALTRPDFSIVKHMQFSESFFFQFLLPPIIFEAGYNMKRQAFFKNFGGIMLYAFVGTFLSTLIVGLGVYAFGQIAGGAISHEIGFLAALVFGSLISATDPVTVLAVFQSSHADLNLYSLVFGESVLNDAVAIVLYRTLVSFRTEPANVGSLMGAIGLFAGIFIGSTVIGIILGLMSALFFKHMIWHERQFLFQEVVLTVVFPWMSYYFAEGLELSGIVAILFCGIVMAQYTYNNLSDHDKDCVPGDKEGRGAKFITRHMFKVIALFAETFVFVYLGFSMFAFDVFRSEVWSMIVVSLIFCFAGRAVNVFPLSHLLNRYRKPNGDPPLVDERFQFIMWFSGLRGGVAFAIAATSYAKNDFPDNGDSQAILQTTLWIAILTIFFMGGSIGRLLDRFDVKEKDSEVDEGTYGHGGDHGVLQRGKTKRFQSSSRMLQIERQYIKPFFTHAQPEGDLSSGHTQMEDEDEMDEEGNHSGGGDNPMMARSGSGAARGNIGSGSASAMMHADDSDAGSGHQMMPIGSSSNTSRYALVSVNGGGGNDLDEQMLDDKYA